MTDPRTPMSAPRDALVGYRLTICGLDELTMHADAEVTHALSIIDPEVPAPAALRAFDGLRQHWTLRFHDIAARSPDLNAPEQDDVQDLIAVGRELEIDADGGHLLVHCHAGVSRSTAAAAILLARANPGREAEAFEAVARLRPGAWPNARMVQLADALLERGGQLAAGLRAMQEARFSGPPGLFGRF